MAKYPAFQTVCGALLKIRQHFVSIRPPIENVAGELSRELVETTDELIQALDFAQIFPQHPRGSM